MGFQFLFSAGLWALPLAGLPVLLHLLFRRKSPVVMFPTLRFIKSSVQHTAARKRVQRWLLLTVRALLLAILIWAIAQPARAPAAGWTGTGKSAIAVIVVDTSYSMRLQDAQSSLLAKADGVVRDLLNHHLRGAKVAIFRSNPPPTDRPELAELRAQETLRDVSQIQWAGLTPQTAPRPLAERVRAAADLLRRQPADDKWLVVVSDFQQREFPGVLPEFAEGRTVLIDLHPDDVRGAGISRLWVSPEQPTPGIRSDAIVDLAGRSGDARQLNLTVGAPDDKAPTHLPPQPANFDSTCVARVRLPVQVPAKGWIRLDASLSVDEPLAWARSRSLLLQVPPQQVVTVLDSPQFPAARDVVALALDPSEGTASAWPLTVRRGNDLSPETNVAVLVSGDWPDTARAAALSAFVKRGNTLLWFLRPGLEETWAALPLEQRNALGELLPGVPVARSAMPEASTVGVSAPADPVLTGLTDEKYQIQTASIRRFVPFDGIGQGGAPVVTLLTAYPATPSPALKGRGLVFRKTLGPGTVFSFGTLPDRRFSGLYLNQTFPPMLAMMSLRPPGRSDAQNVDVGSPLTLAGPSADREPELRMQGPQGDVTVVRAAPGVGPRRFIFDRTDTPGIYTWRRTADDAVVALANVQYPGAEAILKYAPATSVTSASPNVIVARSAGELESRFGALSQPQPRWAVPIAIVMLLMCVEAFMGSTQHLWKASGWRGFFAAKGSLA